MPSRVHPGKFYALPQAPQQFKQLLMVAGFDRYFQIAPCFRDEDGRADRSPGEFYQLDLEMSFVTQDDVFAAIEPVLARRLRASSRPRPTVTPAPFPRIAFDDAMATYGTRQAGSAQPDRARRRHRGLPRLGLRGLRRGGRRGRGGPRDAGAAAPRPQPRSFFDKTSGPREQGAPGLGYVVAGRGRAPRARSRKLPGRAAAGRAARRRPARADGDAVFFVCDARAAAERLAGRAARQARGGARIWSRRTPSGSAGSSTSRCTSGTRRPSKIDFSHNPFSMPQGGLEALETQDPLTIKAYQYDIVCNGVELSSGAIRNHRPDIMYKAFAIAGYSREDVEAHFGGMLNAFKFGAPPHGGSAPGIDRIVMLLAGESNIREVIAFPMNQQSAGSADAGSVGGAARAPARAAHSPGPARAAPERKR